MLLIYLSFIFNAESMPGWSLQDRGVHPIENIEVFEKTIKVDDNVKICRLLTYQESADISGISGGP